MITGRLMNVVATVSVTALLPACGVDREAEAKAQMLAVGETLYTKNCKVCHAQGVNGAPIVGNAKMWGPRAGQGIDVLVGHAVNGFGLMPAKGGRTELSEEDIRAVVGYMLSKLNNGASD